MDKLFKLYNSIALKKGFRLEVYHSEAMNWCVTIHSNSGEKITDIENSEMEPAFMKAYKDLKNWLKENGEHIYD